MAETHQKILIIRLSAIGDVLRVLPAFQVIRKSFPEAHIAWAVEEKAAAILRAHPEISEVIIFPKESLAKKLKSPGQCWAGIRELFAFAGELRRKRFDMVFDFHGLLKSGLISFFSRAPERVGFAAGSCRELNYLFNNRRFSLDDRRISRIERNLTLLRKWGLDTAHAPPAIHVPESDRLAIQDFLKQLQIDPGRPLIAIHPGTSPTTPYKRWEPYRYAVVADRAIEDNAAQVIFTWAGREIETVKEIMAQMKYRAHIAPETKNLCQLAEIFRSCSLYLGGDTGPMHLAAFVGVPVIALFGPTDHIVNESYAAAPHIIVRSEVDCSPCRKQDCTKRVCMKEIKEAGVIRAVNIMLQSISPGRQPTAPGPG